MIRVQNGLGHNFEDSSLNLLKNKIIDLKKQIKEEKNTEGDANHLSILVKKLKKISKSYRKLYMKIYSENYYAQHPDKVIKAVMKYQNTPKGKLVREKYNKSEKKKQARKRYELTIKAKQRQIKWREK